MKVLFVTNMYPSEERPGVGTFVQHQVEGLRRVGHEIDVYQIRGDQSKFNYLWAVGDVVRITGKTRYDIVHAQYGLSAIPAVFRRNAPLVVTLHGSDALVGQLQPWISKHLCRRADSVIVVSKEIASVVPGEIIPCGVDFEKFRPIPKVDARKQLGLPVSAVLILFPFSPKRAVKRYDLAQAAVGIMRDRGERAELLVIHGVDNDKMPYYYGAADAMLLCSDSEGSPTSVKEALACNVPVVSVDVGDVREIVNGIAGVIICKQCAHDLAAGLLESLEMSRKKVFVSRPMILRYDQRNVTNRIVQVYERVLGSKSLNS